MEIKKGVLFGFLISFFVFSCISRIGASSAGVSPALYEVDFQPGYEGNFHFDYLFSEDSLAIVISVRGDLAQYVTLSKDSLTGGGAVEVNLKLPQGGLEPGTHRIEIVANPDYALLQRAGGGTVGAVPAVAGVIKVYVPYPGKYVDTEFEIKDSNEKERTPFTLKIYSRGNEQVTTNSKIEVFDSLDKSLGVFELGEDAIEPTASAVINSEIDTSNYGSGDYRAVAIVNYGSGERKAERSFKIGELFVSIVNYTREVEKNKINQFFVEVESHWNDQIDNVYAEITANGTSFRTPSISLPAWQRGTLQGYFDTSGIVDETVQANVTLHYGGKTTEEIGTINLKAGKFRINYLVVGLVGVIVLIIVLFAWFYFRLRKLEKNGKNKNKKE